MLANDRLMKLLRWTIARSLSERALACLSLGRGAYQHAPALANPGHDAVDVGAALDGLSFAVARIGYADRVALVLHSGGRSSRALFPAR